MTSVMTQSAPDVTDVALRHAIEHTLSHRGASSTVRDLRRRPSAYATSCALEEVVAELDDGCRLELMLKNLSRAAMSQRAVRAKPSFLHDPCREIAVYRRILAPFGLGAAFYGATADRGRDEYWLLIERVQGRELYQLGDLGAWIAAARWLADLHQRIRAVAPEHLAQSAHLVRYDADFYRLWMTRAKRFLATANPCPPVVPITLRRLAAAHERVIDRLTELPLTVVHGEFYPSNVLAACVGREWRVWPVDWEMAAIGPGIMDLAALTLGRWRHRDRRAVIAAYVAATGDHQLRTLASTVELIDYAQIQLAVQWLGWFGRRRAPEHAQDWLSEAIVRAERLGL